MGMKANKKHNTKDEGFVYVGIRAKRRVFGRSKVGTTENPLKTRISCIRSKGEKDFTVKAYIRLRNCTKSQLEFIESAMKVELEKCYQHVQNDHFEYKLIDKEEDNKTFVDRAIRFGTEACQWKHLNYEVVYVK